MKTLLRGIKAAMFAFTAILCGNAWAEIGDAVSITNIGAGGYGASTFKTASETYTLTIPTSETPTSEAWVRIDTIALGMNSDQDAAKTPKYLKVNGVLSEIVNGTGNQVTNVKFANNSLKQTYTFTRLLVQPGTAYTLEFCSDTVGTKMGEMRWYMVNSENSAPLAQSSTSSGWRITQEISGKVVDVSERVYENSIPSTEDCTYFTSDSWAGTVWIKGYGSTRTYGSIIIANSCLTGLKNYGNANSLVKFSGVTAYTPDETATCPYELILENDSYEYAWKNDNGWSGRAQHTFGRLSGSGKFLDINAGNTQALVFAEASEFGGTFDIKGKKITLGGTTNLATTEGQIAISEGTTAVIADGVTWSAGVGGVKVDGTLKFTEDASALSAITRYNQFSLSGSGLIDLSEAKGQNAGNNNLRIAIRGASHSFTGDVTVPANVNLVFAATDTDCTGMKFGGGGFVCVLGTAVNLNGTWTTAAGAYIGTGATLNANGGTLTGRLYFCDNSNLTLGSLTETSLTVAGERFETAGTVHVSLPNGTPSNEKVTLISWKKTQNVTAARLDVSNIPEGYVVNYDEAGLYLEPVADSTVETISPVTNRLTIPNVYLGNGGVQKFTGVGGVLIDDLQIRNGGKIVVNPTRQPIKLSKAPVFEDGAKIALADEHSSCKLGKFTLMTWTGDAVEIPEGLFDSSSFIASTTLVCEAAPTSGCHQLTLKIGNYDDNATVLRIMPLGDSITDGTSKNAAYEANPNYRVPLMQKLAARGYKPVTSGLRECAFNNRYATDASGVIAPAEYRWHSGVSGARVRTSYRSDRGVNGGWREAIETTLDAAGDVDIITFKIGTNDAGDDKNLVFAAWKDVVWRILNARPSVKIVVTSILNMNGNDVWESGYNALIKAQCELDPTAEGAFPAGRVFYVNLHDACPRSMDGISNFTDAYHPNWIGHDRTSDEWVGGVEKAIAAMTFPTAKDTFEKNTKTGAANNVPEAYRTGYVQLATKALAKTAQGEAMRNTAATYDSMTADATKTLSRIAYYLELKNKTTGHVRYVWTSMDAFGATKTLSGMGVPTNYAKWGEVTNLRVVSNDTGIRTTGADAEGIKGRLQFTYGGVTEGGSVEGAPTQLAKWDWNDAINGSEESPAGEYGAMQVYRVFDPVETDGNGAETVFAYNRWSASGNQATEIGIGNFAMHGAYAGGDTSNGSINYMFTSGYETVDASAYELMNLEIWGVPEEVETNAAEVGGVKYATLDEAMTHLTGWATLKLLKDVTLESTISLDALAKGTIDLNNHTISVSGDNLVFDIASGANVTIQGSGTVASESGDYAIQTAAAYLYLDPTNGSPDIGGIIALPAAESAQNPSAIFLVEGYSPSKQVKIWADWTGKLDNSKTTVINFVSNKTTDGKDVIDFAYDPIKEIDGVIYYANFDSRFVNDKELVYRLNYVYKTGPVTITAEHAAIWYLQGVITDPDTGLKYAAFEYCLKTGSMIVGGVSVPQYSWLSPKNNEITFEVRVANGYQNPVVTANGVIIEPGTDGRYTITPEKIGTDIVVTAEKIPTVPSWVDGGNPEAVASYNTWATANRVTDPTTALKGAFALNCANNQSAIDEKAKEFKVEITIIDGKVYVEVPSSDYNIEPIVRASATVGGDYDLEQNDPDARFFKAFIDF